MALAASAMVAPEVTMSSTIKHVRPANLFEATKLPRRLPDRCTAFSPAWSAV